MGVGTGCLTHVISGWNLAVFGLFWAVFGLFWAVFGPMVFKRVVLAGAWVGTGTGTSDAKL